MKGRIRWRKRTRNYCMANCLHDMALGGERSCQQENDFWPQTNPSKTHFGDVTLTSEPNVMLEDIRYDPMKEKRDALVIRTGTRSYKPQFSNVYYLRFKHLCDAVRENAAKKWNRKRTSN